MKIRMAVRAKDIRTGDEIASDSGWFRVESVDRDAGWGLSDRGIDVKVGGDSFTVKPKERLIVLREVY